MPFRDKRNSRDDKSRGRRKRSTGAKSIDRRAGESTGRGPGSNKFGTGRRDPKQVFRSRKPKVNPENDGLVRLNRYVANAGVCSRRKADDLIVAGVISVNGK